LAHAGGMDVNAFYSSALSVDGIIGHASYLLLILSMLMTRMALLRVLAVASGLLSISYSVMIADFVSAIWEVIFVAVNLGQLCLHAYRNRVSRFSPDERAFREAVVPLLEPAQARKLLDLGQWREAAADTTLIEHGELASHMLFIAAGELAIRVGDTVVGRCGAGALSGEISVLTNMPATATVTTRTVTRYLAFERHALHQLMRREPEVEHAIDQCFRTGMRQKLAEANQALADAGSMAVSGSS
jgi:CRP-like cAMP-binding protein